MQQLLRCITCCPDHMKSNSTMISSDVCASPAWYTFTPLTCQDPHKAQACKTSSVCSTPCARVQYIHADVVRCETPAMRTCGAVSPSSNLHMDHMSLLCLQLPNYGPGCTSQRTHRRPSRLCIPRAPVDARGQGGGSDMGALGELDVVHPCGLILCQKRIQLGMRLCCQVG